jgi:5'(3')-deoxyribonucleotidase
MKKIFLDLDGTLVKFNVPNALKRFETEKGFFARLGAYKGIEIINEMAKQGNVYIISASPNIYADLDKKYWIRKYLNNIPNENIVFCRLGENKAKAIKVKTGITIDQNCYLLDDYTKNLIEWEEVGGIGIKRITTVSDNSTKKWTGKELKELCKLGEVIA